jgi:hypothetical protein
MEKSTPSWIPWSLAGLLLVINFILVGAFIWQYHENGRLRQQSGGNKAEAGALAGAYVKLYSDQEYKGEVLTILPSQAPPNETGVHGDVGFLVDVQPDNGTSRNFNDKASSTIYLLPKGWSVVLFQDAQYQNRQLRLVGTGQEERIPDFQATDPPLNDNVSSVRWIQE